MKTKSQPKDQARREFIKKSTLAGAGVAAASMAGTNAIASVSDDTEQKPGQKGYHLTQHILDYYKSAGI
ncbi:MAG: twin-arginine translocation signal domain-containing protein [Gammaproteobacteria bacterium]